MSAQMLVGTFTSESSDNMDEYLKALGVGLVLRKVQFVARPTYKIAYQGETNQWTVVSESVSKTKEVTFKPGEKFEDETFDCRKCQTTVEILEDGRIMKLNQICEEGPSVETIIVATETGFTMTMKSGEFTCEIKSLRSPVEINQAAAPRDVVEE